MQLFSYVFTKSFNLVFKIITFFLWFTLDLISGLENIQITCYVYTVYKLVISIFKHTNKNTVYDLFRYLYNMIILNNT